MKACLVDCLDSELTELFCREGVDGEEDVEEDGEGEDDDQVGVEHHLDDDNDHNDDGDDDDDDQVGVEYHLRRL